MIIARNDTPVVSVPIANSPYCGTTFDLTLRAGGRSSSAGTAMIVR